MTVLPSIRFLLGHSAPQRMYNLRRKMKRRTLETMTVKTRAGKTSWATPFSSSMFSSNSSTFRRSFMSDTPFILPTMAMAMAMSAS